MVRILRKVAPMLLLALTPAATSFGTNTSAGIFDPMVKTLSVRNHDFFMAPPVIRMGSEDRLTVNFDIIGDSHEYLRYRLIHCNADWQPSRLLESEYLEGFNEAEISDYAYSSNTYVHFVNYNIAIPNDDVRFLAGGNYLLQVYREDNPDDIILQTRFAVSENASQVNGNVTSRTDRGFNTEWQQLDIDIDLTGLPVKNPYQDLVVTVTQNNRPETTRTVSHPLRVESNHAIFAHDQNLIFEAGNEYRRFETVRADYPGMHTDSVKFGGTNWHAYLAPDTPRTGRNHIYDRTQHGRFLVNEYNATDPDLGADYVTVHFTLDSPEIVGADIYVDGDFAQNRHTAFNRMNYDFNTGLYTADIPLKQGSYNYQYVALPKGYDGPSDAGGTKVANAAVVEGNYYETGNEYLVKVFLRTPGARADRLIGTLLITSGS